MYIFSHHEKSTNSHPLSLFSMLKVCIDLNLQRIHVKVDGGFIELAIKAIGYLPFFLACIIFRLFALSLLLAYLTFWTLIPLAVVILINLAYEKKR